MIVIYNIPGIIILAIGFAVSFGLRQLLNLSGDGPMMLLAGPLIAGMDLYYRAQHDEPRWFHPNYGGMLFFVPCWGLGIFWLVVGIVYTLKSGG